MTDLEFAKQNLAGNTICLSKDGALLVSGERGISPMMDFIASGRNLSGWSAADIIVGKAVALLFVGCGIRGVYARTLSEEGKRVLERAGVYIEYARLVPRIINRAGTDTCPMEKAVQSCDDPGKAYAVLKNKLASMV